MRNQKNESRSEPLLFKGVMVSSTFHDLELHRRVLGDIVRLHNLVDIGMEHDTARADLDLIDSSLQMVRDAFAFIAIIGRHYGQVLECPVRNPDSFSLSELEFNEAQSCGLPILLFVMSIAHSRTEPQIELDPLRRKKLDAFRERAKFATKDSHVHNVYADFDSVESFGKQAGAAVARLRRFLDEKADAAASALLDTGIPRAPALYAKPPYARANAFLGRKRELDMLDAWAAVDNDAPILLFQAIGGTGKTMLTWEWLSGDKALRGDWKGRFWYSFYVRGATLTDFCLSALTYISGLPRPQIEAMPMSDVAERLLALMRADSWLLAMDGLERILVAYHDINAAQLLDENMDAPVDPIAKRHSCAAIQVGDDDLLRSFAAAYPSKLLISSRLVPRALLNSAGTPIAGVIRELLPGLLPADAEALMRSFGVRGDSAAIRCYLQEHCGCHPLVIAVLAGLIRNYLPDRHNFDRWANDPAGGGRLKLHRLDLKQKRNHILDVALEALAAPSKQLLSTLALLSGAIDYDTLCALNPHLPPPPSAVEDLIERSRLLGRTGERVPPSNWANQIEAIQSWRRLASSPEMLDALTRTVVDLSDRGLLLYDEPDQKFDLHPVVRAVAADRMGPSETNRCGNRFVDYFSLLDVSGLSSARSLEKLQTTIEVVKTLIRQGHYSTAVDIYAHNLNEPLHSLSEQTDHLAIMAALFKGQWGARPPGLSEKSVGVLAHNAGNILKTIGAVDDARTAYATSLRMSLSNCDLANVALTLLTLMDIERVSSRDMLLQLARDLLSVDPDAEISTLLGIVQYDYLHVVGRHTEAAALWERSRSDFLSIESGARRFFRRKGSAMACWAEGQLRSGALSESDLIRAEQAALDSPFLLRQLKIIRGSWYAEQHRWDLALDAFRQAVQRTRAADIPDHRWEICLDLARWHLGKLSDPADTLHLHEASAAGCELELAELAYAMGESDMARRYAVAAYNVAWEYGRPCDKRALGRATRLLRELGIALPAAPAPLPARPPYPWEAEIRRAIERPLGIGRLMKPWQV